MTSGPPIDSTGSRQVPSARRNSWLLEGSETGHVSYRQSSHREHGASRQPGQLHDSSGRSGERRPRELEQSSEDLVVPVRRDRGSRSGNPAFSETRIGSSDFALPNTVDETSARGETAGGGFSRERNRTKQATLRGRERFD